ncbi:MAG TPA: hypothetical protein VGB44_00580 [Flavobacterium sp.]|jgi:hypothetical protein
MAETLQRTTSTLMVKVPSQVLVPPYKEKSRAQKSIIRAIVQILQSKELELIYVGPRPDTTITYIEPTTFTEDSTVITINVLEDNSEARDFNTSQHTLLKSFKKEIQCNSEHIIIDNTVVKDGKSQRRIEVYIKSRHSVRPAAVPSYTFSKSATTLDYSRSW